MLNLESVQVFDKQLLGSVSAEVVPLVLKRLKHFKLRSFFSLHSWLNFSKTGQSGLEKKAEQEHFQHAFLLGGLCVADRQFRFSDKLMLRSYSSVLFCLKQNHDHQIPETHFSSKCIEIEEARLELAGSGWRGLSCLELTVEAGDTLFPASLWGLTLQSMGTEAEYQPKCPRYLASLCVARRKGPRHEYAITKTVLSPSTNTKRRLWSQSWELISDSSLTGSALNYNQADCIAWNSNFQFRGLLHNLW